jgi:secreted trypsin-like serine protease
VVRFFTLDAAENVLGFCSGTLIAPNAVLTATHCFLSGREAFVVVVLGEGDNVEFANAVQINSAPGFRVGGPATGNRLFNDAAILLLDRNVSSPAMPVLVSRAPVVGEPGFVYGYGTTEVGGDFESVSVDVLKGGAMTISEVTPNHIFVVFDGSGVNVCKGDSGGPVIVEVNGQPALAGITSQGSNATCQAGDVTTFTNLQSDSVVTWLTDVVPGASLR